MESTIIGTIEKTKWKILFRFYCQNFLIILVPSRLVGHPRVDTLGWAPTH